MNTPSIFLLTLSLILTSCNLPRATTAPQPASPSPRPQATSTPVLPTSTATHTAIPSAIVSSTSTPSQTPTLTATITLTPQPSASPTYAFPQVTVNQQAHCRYGPAKSHLHAADLYPGDSGTVRGRFQYSQWLYIKFDKLTYFCWVAPSVVTVQGDISLIQYAEVRLPGPSVLYNPPQNVSATRTGDKVTIRWDAVNMTKDDDRGYFLELFVCQNGNSLWWTFSYPDQYTTSYTVKDEKGCLNPSGGMLYAVEKHGYTRPAAIPWPKP